MLFKYFSSALTKPVVIVKPPRTYYTIQCCLNLCKSNVTSKHNTRLVNSNLNVKQYLNNNFVKCFTSLSNHNRHPLITKQQIDNCKLYNNRLLYISQYLGDKKLFENDKISAKDLEILSIQYPQTKNVLHNYFSVVSKELGVNYKVSPVFKKSVMKKNDKNPLHWTCMYHIKWPEDLKFQHTALTKIEASNKAACKALLYLQNSGKLLKNGSPVIYDKEDAKKITRESNYSLILDEMTESKLNSISSIFETNIKPYISSIAMEEDDFSRVETNATLAEANVLSDWSLSKKQKTNKQLLQFYRAKETVELPIQNHRKEFEDLLDNNRVVIIRGEPGCGKSTRIPQYVLEHWVTHMGDEPARIVVTQPRRIAAISLAERVAQERDERVGTVVGYQVRLKSQFNPQTGRILYCTTGILLRQLQADPAMTKCTHVILDEAHERDVNTDLLMNLIRHALTLNPNLKVIIMSATIDVGLFQTYFTQSPVMNVPGFTYPVKVNFLDDIKLNLPRTRDNCNNSNGSSVVYDEVAQVIRWIDRTKPAGAILCFLPGWEEISKVRNNLQQHMNTSSSLIVAIHSKLSHDEQKRIFRRPPPGVRKVILATNIAETSVTVDDVVYVVDTGVHKESRFDSDKGVACIDNHWISQSSMNQRKGRAGRVQPGESFHLYTRAKYAALLKYSVPEILRVSLTKIVLDAKVYSHNMRAIDFFMHLPCPPDNSAVYVAVQELQDLEMLDGEENLTPLGRVVSDFQLAPKLSKAMIHAVVYKCVVPIVDIATLFSSDQNVFSNVLTEKEAVKMTKERLSKDSDHIAMMILYEQWANFMNNEEFHEAATYCTKNNLVPHKLNTLKQLKDIHYDYLAKYLRNVLELSDDYSASKEFIKGVLLSGVGNVLLHRNWDVIRGRLKKASVFVTKNKHKATITSDSVNHKRQTYESPFLIYINEMRSEMRRTTIIRETSMIQPLTLVLFNNSKLIFQQIADINSTNIKDPVLVNLEGTKLYILCNKQQAQVIQKCKNALKQMEKYFIYQLTKGGEENPEIHKNWNEILHILNDVLQKK